MKTKLTIFLISISLISYSQKTSGVVTYEETTNFQIDMEKLEEQGMSEFASMMPKSMSNKKQLYFTKDSLLYSNLKEDKEEKKSNGPRVMMFSNSDEKTFINFQTNTVVEQKDFMGKMFLIEDTIGTLNWKMTGETKVILNYPCIKAVITDSLETVEAWFTTEIPFSIGPEKYGQLPGMILELSSKSTRKTITAVDFQYKELEAENIYIPSDGKKVTKKKFEETMDKKMKEMKQEYGGKDSGDGIMIIRQER